MYIKRWTTWVAIAILSVASAALSAEKIALKADLNASSEVPAKDSAGHGELTATLDTDTNELAYHIIFEGLTGNVVAAHFHGPAAPGSNAKPQIPIRATLSSPIDGKAKLTAEQAADLLAGKWYFNLHTAANASGEIRGQIVKTQ